MTPGGADPDAVLDIIRSQIPTVDIVPIVAAEDVVKALEHSGYRIVRAGMVPKLEQMEHVAEVMQGVHDSIPSGVLQTATHAQDASKAIRQLIEMAVMALGLDPDDRDDPDGST